MEGRFKFGNEQERQKDTNWKIARVCGVKGLAKVRLDAGESMKELVKNRRQVHL